MALHLLCAAHLALACDRLPAGQTLWIRLTTPVSTSTVRVGDPVAAVLTQDLLCGPDVVLPLGTRIDAVVRSKRKVGWGIRHESAALEIQAISARPAPGISLPLSARVEEVVNARELVHRGIIEGIRSSDTFQGSINSRLIHLPTFNPYSDPVLIVFKTIFPIFPEPEIVYPAGTDLRLGSVTGISVPSSAPHLVRVSLSAPDAPSSPLDPLVQQLPWRVTTLRHVDADLINIVFTGSQDLVAAAFREAGWENADPVSRHSVFRNLYALLDNTGYPREPMRTFYLDGRSEDMNWQKSLNSYGRRDHLRIWQWSATPDGEPVWLSSSTHDTGAVLAVRYRGFVHHIAPDIDDERATVLRDLNFAGCVRSVRYVPRHQIPTATHNSTGDVMHTDGSVAVVDLQPCRTSQPRLDRARLTHDLRPGNYGFRFVRRQILTFRNDIWRANIIYGAYDLGRLGVTALRHPAPEQP